MDLTCTECGKSFTYPKDSEEIICPDPDCRGALSRKSDKLDAGYKPTEGLTPVEIVDTLKPEYEHVNHPPHYNKGGIECIEAIRAALTEEEFRGFCKGNSLKYVWREKHKKGSEDLEKSNWYLNQIITKKNEDAQEINPSKLSEPQKENSQV